MCSPDLIAASSDFACQQARSTIIPPADDFNQIAASGDELASITNDNLKQVFRDGILRDGLTGRYIRF